MPRAKLFSILDWGLFSRHYDTPMSDDMEIFLMSIQGNTYGNIFDVHTGKHNAPTTKFPVYRVRNLKFATYLKFATCENTNKINELW